MNSKAQFNFHPDAESLNAFAEEALDEGERGQVLAHLAVCTRCREVVFLAQQAADAEGAAEWDAAAVAAAAPVAEERRAKPHRWWTGSGWLVWVPVGALAAIVSIAAYVIQARHARTGSEMAKVTTESSEKKTTAPQESLKSSTEPSLPAPKKPVTNKAEAPRPAARAPYVAVPAPAAPPPEPATSAASNEAPPVPGARLAVSLAGGAEDELKQQSAEAYREKKEMGAASAGAVHGAAAAAIDKNAARREEVNAALAAAAPVAQTEAQPAAAAGMYGRKIGGNGGGFAVYRAVPLGLPSSLPAVSTATRRQELLAVDKDGGVFLSDDAGSHWETVARQWDGRAVAVRMHETAKPGEQDSADADLFELVNDHGQVWVSTDGRNWKVQ